MKKVLIVILVLLFGAIIFSVRESGINAEFRSKLDSLNRVNDSLVLKNVKSDSVIMKLQVEDSLLKSQVANQKTKIIEVRVEVKAKQDTISKYTDSQLVDFYYKRYPKDSLKKEIALAQPVLVSAAKDLVAYDGAVKELNLKDSIIILQESRISTKDSTITLFENKEVNYRAIIGNKDQAITEWTKQYNSLELNYKKLEKKNKLQKTIMYVVAGGIVCGLLIK